MNGSFIFSQSLSVLVTTDRIFADVFVIARCWKLIIKQNNAHVVKKN